MMAVDRQPTLLNWACLLLATVAIALEHDACLDIQGQRVVVTPANSFNPAQSLVAQVGYDGSIVALDIVSNSVATFALSDNSHSVVLLRPGCPVLSAVCMLAHRCRVNVTSTVADAVCQPPVHTARATISEPMVHRVARS